MQSLFEYLSDIYVSCTGNAKGWMPRICIRPKSSSIKHLPTKDNDNLRERQKQMKPATTEH